MITQKQAEQLVYEHINRPDGYWPDKPEMIVVHIADHELGWIVFYDSRPHHETHEIRHAIAGNAPFLVSHEDGTMFPTGTAAPFEERVREAEQKLRAHLESKSTENSTDSYPRLPNKFGSKVASYPECSYGAVRVTLILGDGRRICDVIIGADAICKIGQKHIRSESDLDFLVSDIVDVEKG
jgi:hypothetical protein